MKYAFINDNEVKFTADFESEEQAMLEAHLYQQVVLIDGVTPEPQAGWKWNNGVIYREFTPLSPRQIRLALILMGISLSDIDTNLDLLPEPTKSLAKVSWEYSLEFYRDDPLVDAVSGLLGWTSEQADYLWEYGVTL